MHVKNNNDEQFKNSVSLRDGLERLLDVANELCDKENVDYDIAIDRCLKEGASGTLPIYLEPKSCLYETPSSNHGFVIKRAFAQTQNNTNKSNVVSCSKHAPELIAVERHKIISNKNKKKTIDINSCKSIPFKRNRQPAKRVRPNFDKKHVADIIIENCKLGTRDDCDIGIFRYANGIENYLKPQRDYFILCDQTSKQKVLIGIYNLERFAEDTVFFIDKAIVSPADFERLSYTAISEIYKGRSSNHPTAIANNILLWDENQIKRELGLLPSSSTNYGHNNQLLGDLSLPKEIIVKLDSLYLLNKHKHKLLSNHSMINTQLSVEQANVPSCKNYAPELRIANEIYHEYIENNDDIEYKRARELVNQWQSKHPEEKLCEEQKQRLSKVINPLKWKEGGAKKTPMK